MPIVSDPQVYYAKDRISHNNSNKLNDLDWKPFCLDKSLEQQQISLDKSESIYYRYHFSLKKSDLFENRFLGIWIGTVDGDLDIFFNGKEYIKSIKKDQIIQFQIPFNILKNDNELVLKVTKTFSFYKMTLPKQLPYLDHYSTIQAKETFFITFSMVISFAILSLGIYYLFFFHSILRNYEFILFFVLCVFIFMNNVIRFPLRFFFMELFNVSWELVTTIEYLFLIFIPAMTFWLISIILNNSQKITKYIILINFGFLSLLVNLLLLGGIEIFHFFLLVFYIHSFILLLWMLILVFQGFKLIIHNVLDLIFIFILVFLIIGFISVDIFELSEIFYSNVIFSCYSVGIFLFIFLIGFLLSKKYLDISLKLKELSLNLEKKVAFQTNRIKETNINRINYFIDIAHESKNNLTLISNYIDRCLIHSSGDDLDVIKNGIDSLKSDMIKFLDHDKLATGESVFDNNQLCAISNLLERKKYLFIESAKKKNVHFAMQINTEEKIQGDPLAVDRIVSNLIGNAIKYSKPKGNIDVFLTSDDDSILFSVRDNGIGISKKDQSFIFDPFYQGSNLDEKEIGNGLGLYIVNKLVQSLLATIKCESKLGVGTHFKVKFPKSINDEVVYKKTMVPNPSFYSVDISVKDSDFRKELMSLLVIDDNTTMLQYLKSELQMDYNVFVASSGNEALNKLKEIPKPKLIVSDIVIGDIDGLKLLDIISKNPEYCMIPFIFITASGGTESELQGIKKGAIDCITKPFNINELRAKIQSLINLNERIRESIINDSIDMLKVQLAKAENNEGSSNKKIWKIFDERCKEYDLTLRQVDVVRLLFQGLEYKEIGEKLFISDKTVKRHLENIYKRLDVRNKVELINKLFEL